MTTKIPAELSSTPSIVDNGDATAITIDSSEKSIFSGDVEVGTTAPKINLKNTDTSIVADQSLGVIEVESSDGSTGSAGTIAKLDIAASGTFDGSGHGSDFRFITGATNQSGSISLSEKLRIQTTGGISFNGDTAAANALDDYEEGTWSVSDGSGAGLSFTLDKNRYTKIGRFVMAHTRVTYPTTSNGNTATLALPFTPSTDCTGSVTGGICTEQGVASGIAVTASIDGTAGTRFRSNGVGAFTNSDLSGVTLRFTVTFITD
jgi:hypothetical protein